MRVDYDVTALGAVPIRSILEHTTTLPMANTVYSAYDVYCHVLNLLISNYESSVHDTARENENGECSSRL